MQDLKTINYDINRPWETLDDWQKEYIFNTPPNQDCFLLCGRQVGKTTAMSIKAVELCVNHFKNGEFVLINSITEKQAYHLLAKASVYARTKYPKKIIKTGREKETKHKLMFKNGTGILCYAAGETGEGLRGFTIKKLMSDEGARMSEEYFIAVSPMMSVIKGSKDIASTPFGKKHKDGTLKYFYKCSLDDSYKKFYVDGEDCPRHSKEFLVKEKQRLSKLAYAQEYKAIFTDELKRIFDDDIINKTCILKRIVQEKINRDYFLGVDVGGMGEDVSSFEILEALQEEIHQRENETEGQKLTTQTTEKILNLNVLWDFLQIGVDDGGIGFGVYSELMGEDATKRKTIALNNARRAIDKDGKKSKKLLKEEMYINLLVCMENNKIKLLDDDDVKASLASIQHDEGQIFGSDSHITEGIIRALWLAKNNKNLKTWFDSIRI